MRFLPLAVLLSACAAEPARDLPEPGHYAGDGRDRLCIAAMEPEVLRGGVIAFGRGDVNCSAAGAIEGAGTSLALVPKGESNSADDCRIPLFVEGATLRFGELPAACAYYCGPGATLSGKRFRRTDAGSGVTDLAGDPLC